MPVKFVPLRELMVNRGSYQGQLVETTGLSEFGFEKSAIYYDSLLKTTDGSIRFTNYGDGLWLEIHPHYPFYSHIPDSLRNTVIRVRGILDTSQHGHMGMYTAELRNIFVIKKE